MGKIEISNDKFNSAIFMLKFGNITHYSNEITQKEILTAIKTANCDFLAVKIDSKDIKALYNFQRVGFYLVDTLLTYEFDSQKTAIPDGIFTCDFADRVTKNNVLRLADIAARVFKIDRFHSDPNLDKLKSDNYYYNWVINSFNGYSDGAIVPVVDGQVVAFTTYKINDYDLNTSTMVLSAVDPNFMGQGIYQNMIKKGTIELLKKSKKIRVGTQVDNIPVQRTWQKLGYKLIEVKYVLHFKVAKKAAK